MSFSKGKDSSFSSFSMPDIISAPYRNIFNQIFNHVHIFRKKYKGLQCKQTYTSPPTPRPPKKATEGRRLRKKKLGVATTQCWIEAKHFKKPMCRRSFHVYIYKSIYEYKILEPKIIRYSTHYITKKNIKTPHYIPYVLLWLKIFVFVILTFSPNMDRIPNKQKIKILVLGSGIWTNLIFSNLNPDCRAVERF